MMHCAATIWYCAQKSRCIFVFNFFYLISVTFNTKKIRCDESVREWMSWGREREKSIYNCRSINKSNLINMVPEVYSLFSAVLKESFKRMVRSMQAGFCYGHRYIQWLNKLIQLSTFYAVQALKMTWNKLHMPKKTFSKFFFQPNRVGFAFELQIFLFAPKEKRLKFKVNLTRLRIAFRFHCLIEINEYCVSADYLIQVFTGIH